MFAILATSLMTIISQFYALFYSQKFARAVWSTTFTNKIVSCLNLFLYTVIIIIHFFYVVFIPKVCIVIYSISFLLKLLYPNLGFLILKYIEFGN